MKQVHRVKSTPNYQPEAKLTFFIKQFTVCHGPLPKPRLKKTKKTQKTKNLKTFPMLFIFRSVQPLVIDVLSQRNQGIRLQDRKEERKENGR